MLVKKIKTTKIVNRKQLKILQINKFYYLRGGSERHLFELEKLLREKGHIAIPFSMQDSRNNQTKYNRYFIKKVDLDKFSIKNIFKFFYNFEAVKNLKKLIKEENPVIAHLHNIAHHLSPAIIKILKKNNIPVIQTLHDYKLICPNYRLFTQNKVCEKCKGGKYYNCLKYKCVKNSRLKSFLAMLEAYLNNKIYKKVDMFIAPSQFMKDKCVEFGAPEKKIKVIYNFLTPPTPSLNKARTDQYILYFGRISSEKGIDVLIEAFKDIKNLKLKIVGAGPDVSNLELRSEKLEIKEKIEILGPKYGEELNELIKNAKAVIIPSVWMENMPYSLLESLAFKVPVIASKIGGMPEALEDGVNGFLFKAGNSADLKDKIGRLTELDQEKLIESNNRILDKFSPENYYTQIEKIYNKLLEQKY